MRDYRARRMRCIQSRYRGEYKVQDIKKSGGNEEGGEACLEDEWGGLGFGTRKEEQDDIDDTLVVEQGSERVGQAVLERTQRSDRSEVGR
jgi:hypothetical protein